MQAAAPKNAPAALELDLQNALADLQAAISEQNYNRAKAEVYNALASEPGQRGARAEAIKFSLRATFASGEIAGHRRRVAKITADIASLGQPLVSAAQCEAMDDTHNFRAVAA